jgi:hypothetical protein
MKGQQSNQRRFMFGASAADTAEDLLLMELPSERAERKARMGQTEAEQEAAALVLRSTTQPRAAKRRQK